VATSGSWPSRLAALTVLALLLALAHAGLVVPYLSYMDELDGQVATKEATLVRMRTLVATPNVQPAPSIDVALLLPDVSEAQAVGQLQDRLKRVAATNGLELQNIQVLPRADMTTVTRLGVRLRGSGDMPALN